MLFENFYYAGGSPMKEKNSNTEKLIILNTTKN